MESFLIKDTSITASSVLSQQSPPSRARLNINIGYGAWCANQTDTSPYIQVDLRWLHEVRAVSTQGQHSSYGKAWIQQYTISYRKQMSNDTWENYMESGVTKVLYKIPFYRLIFSHTSSLLSMSSIASRHLFYYVIYLSRHLFYHVIYFITSSFLSRHLF
jgi:hypothetical protein